MSPIEELEGEQFSKSGRSIGPGLDRPHLHSHQEPLSYSNCLMIPGQTLETKPVINMDDIKSKLCVSDVGTFQEFSTLVDSDGGQLTNINTICSDSDDIENCPKTPPKSRRSNYHSPSLPDNPTQNDLSLDYEFLTRRAPGKSRFHRPSLVIQTKVTPKPNSVHPVILIKKPDLYPPQPRQTHTKNFKKNPAPSTVQPNNPNDSGHSLHGIPDIAIDPSSEEMEIYQPKNFDHNNGINLLYRKD